MTVGDRTRTRESLLNCEASQPIQHVFSKPSLVFLFFFSLQVGLLLRLATMKIFMLIQHH